MNITLVLDTSGSMSSYARIQMLRQVCLAISASLRAGDVVSMVTWSTGSFVELAAHEVSGPSDSVLNAAIQGLEANGGTDFNGGLIAGYELANQVYAPERINRMVMISDGYANAGVTELDLISSNAELGGSDGIYLVGVGVGTDDYNDALMDAVTDAGKGASVFIANSETAWDRFNANFINTMMVAARNVRVRIDLPPGFEITKFSGEEFGEDPTEIEPQHISPNDAMVFNQDIETCAPELATDEDEFTVVVSWEDAVTFEPRATSRVYSFGDLKAAGAGANMLKGDAIEAFTEALQDHQWNGGSSATESNISAVAAVDAALAMNPSDAELNEIRSILLAL